MDVQQCINRCLVDSAGAGDDAYNSCVENNCNSAPEEDSTPRADRWTVAPLRPDVAPYLDGRIASVVSYDASLVFSYSCGRDGDSHMFIAPKPWTGIAADDPFKTVNAQFKVGRRAARIYGFSGYEGQLVGGIPPGDDLFGDLKAGNRVQISLPGWAADFTLKGSSAALNEALDYCGTSGRVEAASSAVSPDVQAQLEASDEGLKSGPALPVKGSEGPLAQAPMDDAPAKTEASAPADVIPWTLGPEREADLRSAAESGDTKALNMLGVALVSGRFGRFDPSGFAFIDQAAEAGYAPALVNRGMTAGHFDRLMSDAVSDYLKAAELGDPVALTLLGQAYDTGMGVPDDEAKAIAYYERAVAGQEWMAAGHLLGRFGDGGKYASLADLARAGGYRTMAFNSNLWNVSGNKDEALKGMIAAAQAMPYMHKWDEGLRYLPNISGDADYDLFSSIIYARRYEASPWSAADFEAILAPIKARYGCTDGRLFLQTTEILGCARE